MTHTPPSQISHLVAVDTIGADGLAVTVETTAAERDALARLNGLVALPALRASLVVRPEPGGGFRVTGAVQAEVTQTCVVSLEPFDAALDEPVDVLFLTPAAHAAFREDHAKTAAKAAAAKVAAAKAGRGKPAPLADDPEDVEEPDLIDNGRIDVGALAAEHLTLGLDPYPRKPGAALPAEASVGEASASPFAILGARRGKDPS